MLLALKAFEFHDVDVAVMEVGMGGLYDATNVIDNPNVCAITHLGKRSLGAQGKRERGVCVCVIGSGASKHLRIEHGFFIFRRLQQRWSM